MKKHNPRKQLAIASESGTRITTSVLDSHLKSECHKECVQADRVSSIRTEERSSTSMEVSIQKANRNQIAYVCKLMITVYLDAKLLNLTAHSWPARYVCGEASSSYKPENASTSIIPKHTNLQYVNPHGHFELMKTIVQSHREEFMKKINEAWAVSLRVDGSIDFTHVDKIYI